MFSEWDYRLTLYPLSYYIVPNVLENANQENPILLSYLVLYSVSFPICKSHFRCKLSVTREVNKNILTPLAVAVIKRRSSLATFLNAGFHWMNNRRHFCYVLFSGSDSEESEFGNLFLHALCIYLHLKI